MSKPLKRARTDVDIELAGTSRNIDALTSNSTRHPDLWFDDGSVILNVGTTLFRVHRSTLSTHSTVFADMFHVPQPPNRDAIEGCPVVHVPDSAKDFTCLLKALYDPFYFAVGATGEISIPFNDVTSVLRLSTKYDIPTFCTKSIFELRKLFPSTLSDFYALFPRGNLDPSHTLIMQAINVARETNVLELLPCAFYFLTRCPTITILKGSTLSRDDIDRCILGREKLLEEQDTRAFALLADCEVSKDCALKPKCSAFLSLLFRKCMEGRLHTKPCTLENLSFEPPDFCDPCSARINSRMDADRQASWIDLPNYFDLGSWEELRNTSGCS